MTPVPVMWNHFPDNPNYAGAELLPDLDAGKVCVGWVAQPKINGYRRWLWFTGGHWCLLSKNRTGNTRPLPLPLNDALCNWKVPEGSGFDAEWYGPVAGLPDNQHKLFFFDLPMFNGEWQGKLSFLERDLRLRELMCSNNDPRLDTLPCYPQGEMQTLFLAQLAASPISEGIVCKLRHSTLVGDSVRPKKNPAWIKFKFAPDVKELPE